MVTAAAVLVSAMFCGHGGAVLAADVAEAAKAAEVDWPPAPSAAKRPHEVTSPNGKRNDDYYWLRDDTRKSPEVLAYLKAENAYFAAYSARYQPLQDKLLAELRGRIQEDDSTVPYQRRGYWYYTRFDEGKEYGVRARKRGSLDAPEEVLLDDNELAAGKDSFQVTGMAVSEENDLLAFTEDDNGGRQNTLRIKDLKTGKMLPERISGVADSMAWAADNKTLFYVENDPETVRSMRVKRHVVGTDPQADVQVYEEKDTSFDVDVRLSGSGRYIVIGVSSTISDEQRVVDATQPTAEFRVIAPRRPNFRYAADHIAGRWIIRTDWQAPNYRLMQVADTHIGDRAAWRPLIAHDAKVFIEDFALFDNFLVLDERSGGLRRLRVQRWSAGQLAGKSSFIQADEAAYTASLDVNPEQNTNLLRYTYSSLKTPASIYEVDMATGERTLKKRQAVLGGYDPARYVTERVWVKARDGARVPVSLVYKKGTPRDGTAPMLQYAYGSYGLSKDAEFRSTRLSLIDRGFVYALAHIRGGQEMGRAWYENGKKLHKKNSFNDFIDVTEALVKQGYADRRKVFAQGGSAGGLLMGAITNMRPDLYRGVVAQVPFVDVVTTMLDESIPLTTGEFNEWGNPKDKRFYDYMLSYSPYDNVKQQPLPALFVSTGLFDSQVQYHEPAKWVAKMREVKKAGLDRSPLIFKINMDAGHGGQSGRFVRLKEVAEEDAFMLDLIGMKE